MSVVSASAECPFCCAARAAVNRLLHSRTLRNVGIVLTENVLARGCSFVLIVLTARMLGPQGFGAYSLVTVSIFFLTSFLDLGMENTALRFASHEQDSAQRIFGLYALVKAGIFLLLSAGVFLAPELIARAMEQPQARSYLTIVFWGALVESYVLMVVTYWQSRERFLIRAGINTGVFALRLAGIGLALACGVRDIRLIAWLYVLSGIPFLLGFAPLLARFVREFARARLAQGLWRQIRHYQKWIVLGAVPIILMTRLDFYAVSYLLSLKEAGWYNAAVQLTAVLSLVMMALRNVFLPKVSKFTAAGQFRQYVRKVHYCMTGVALLTALALPLCGRIVVLLYGPEYAQAAGVLRILLCAFVCTFWNVLLSIVFYAAGQARLMAIGAYIQLAVFVGFTAVCAPRMQMAGVALSRCVSDVAYLAIVFFFLPRIIRQWESSRG